MPAELQERDATGEIAATHEEIPELVVFARMIGDALPRGHA
jgi:hypothetical protein